MSRLARLFLLSTFVAVLNAQDRISLAEDTWHGQVTAVHAEGITIATAAGVRFVPWSDVRYPGVETAQDVVITLANGDRLTGRILATDARELSLATAYVPEIRLPVTALAARPAPVPEPSKAEEDKTSLEAEVEKGILEVKDWTGKVSLLGTYRSGNVDSALFQLDAGVDRQWVADRFSAGASLSYGKTEGDLTAAQARAGAKWDHFYNEDFYSYARTDVEWDDVNNLDLRAIVGIGVGLNVWTGDGDHRRLDLEAGIDGIYEKYEESSSGIDLAGRLALVYKDVFFEKLLFTEEFEFIFPVPEVADYLIRSKTTLAVALSEHWYFQNIVDLKYQASAPDEVEPLDVKVLVGVEYKF
jgi:putative salt-induced outer membrane protein YdiY